MFDAVTPAVVASDLVVSVLLRPDRAARLVEQTALDPSLPALGDVIDALFAATFDARARSPYQAEVKRAVERVVINSLIDLASTAPMPQVRAVASLKLAQRASLLGRVVPTDETGRVAGEAATAHAMYLVADIRRFLERPAEPAAIRTAAPQGPPGAPIGEPAMEWLRRIDEPCDLP
jgi:hypothetical protein